MKSDSPAPAILHRWSEGVGGVVTNDLCINIEEG